jgi:hypothetical protein
MTDTTTLTGAQFRREVGADPEKWAEAFVRSTAGEMSDAEILERASWVTPWFRDAMVEASRAGSLRTLASVEVKAREVEPLTPMENTMLRDMLGGFRIALAAHERGDDEQVSEFLRLGVKRLQRQCPPTS